MYVSPSVFIYLSYLFWIGQKIVTSIYESNKKQRVILPTALISEKQNTLTLNTDHFNFIGCFVLHDEDSLHENTPEKNCPVMD